MKFDFDKPIDRHGTFSKWDAGAMLRDWGITTRFDRDSIPLFTADMDFECAPSIKEEIMKVAERNLYGYTLLDDGNKGPYVEAVRSWFKRRHGWEFGPECVSYSDGTVTAMKNAMLAVTEPGDGVLLNMPIYSPFMSTITGNGRVIVNSQLINDGTGYYTMDFDDLEKKAADPKVKAIMLCSPHNPTGRVWTKEELIRLHEICRANGVTILADELHGDLIRKGQVFHPIEKITDGKGIITCTGLGKTFNVAGLHCSNVIITDPELQEKYKKQMAGSFMMPTAMSIAATIGAYTGGDEWVDAVNEYLDGNIDTVCDFVRERLPKVVLRKPEGTYIMWLDFRAYGLDSREVSRRISEGANVILEHGEMFDPEHGGGFERICTPTRRAVLMEAMERIAAQF